MSRSKKKEKINFIDGIYAILTLIKYGLLNK